MNRLSLASTDGTTTGTPYGVPYSWSRRKSHKLVGLMRKCLVGRNAVVFAPALTIDVHKPELLGGNLAGTNSE